MLRLGRLTAIEYGVDTCVLVKTAVKGGSLRVSAVDTMDPFAFPGLDAFGQAIREARRRLHMPRRARVVLWGAPEGATQHDPFVESILRPIRTAGFHIDRVVSPCDALAALARTRTPRTDGAVLWIAINRGGVALVAVRPGEQLYARSTAWDSSIGSTGTQARMLQRYTQVAFLAPEIDQAIAAVARQGRKVETVVTCGNLPDLRSLTMPLIEELDVEVETLDSFDGLVLSKDFVDRYAELAPAIRLACAGAFARPARARVPGKGGLEAGTAFRAAALGIAALGLGYLWYARSSTPKVVPPAPPPQAATPRAPQPAQPAANQTPPVPRPVAQGPTTSAPQPPAQGPTTSAPQPPAQHGPTTPAPKPPAPSPTTPASKPAAQGPAPASPRPGSTAPLRSADKPRDAVPPKPLTDPLPDPLPHISTILLAEGRRIALLDDGRRVTVGDTIGQRVVAAIESRAVVLREPSGIEVRVGLGGRLLSVSRLNR